MYCIDCFGTVCISVYMYTQIYIYIYIVSAHVALPIQLYGCFQQIFLLLLQVSSLELVQELHQVLMDREETCHRTCFSLQINGKTLDNFAELKTVEDLKDGIEIKVVEGIVFILLLRSNIGVSVVQMINLHLDF